MKRIKCIFLSTFIIVSFSTAGSLSLAVEAKKATTPPNPSAKAAPAAANATVQGQAKPAPAAVNATVQGQAKTVPAQITQPVTVTAKKVAVPTLPKGVVAVAPPPPPAPVQGPIPGYALVNQGDVYSYNPLGKPDPFLPYIDVELAKKKEKKVQIEKKAALSIFPLQRAEATMYKVVGIVGSEDHRMAIAEDSSKKFFPLLIGTRIGLRNGKVVEILEDRVIVEEYEKNKASKVILKLRKN